MKPVNWVCFECGNKHGRRHFQRDIDLATWHLDKCDICGKERMVTEPRDFGGLKEEARCGTCGGRL